MNITNEQNNSVKEEVERMMKMMDVTKMQNQYSNHNKVEKTLLERQAELISPQVRAEMIQLGLNPFNSEDLRKYSNICTDRKRLSLGKRLKAAWKLLWKAELTNDLIIAVIQTEIEEKDILTSGEDLNLPLETNNSAETLVKKVLDKEPSGICLTDTKEWADELKKVVESKFSSPAEESPTLDPLSTLKEKRKKLTEEFKGGIPLFTKAKEKTSTSKKSIKETKKPAVKKVVKKTKGKRK